MREIAQSSIREPLQAAEITTDVVEEITRSITITVFALSLTIWLFLGVQFVEILSPRFFGFGAILAIFAISVRVIPARRLVGQFLWQLGLLAVMTLGLVLYPQSFIRFYYVLAPFVAVVTIGPYAGMLMVAMVVALMAVLGHREVLPPLGSPQSLEVIVGSVACVLIGWAALHPLLNLSTWAVYYARQAQESLERARARQEELAQTQADLVQANQQLAGLTDRLRALQRVAEEARQAKSEFVANVSHELRAPLNMIIGFSEMITRSPRTYGTRIPPALLADIATIQRNALHLSRLIDDVLDLSQIEAGRMALHKTVADPQSIVRSALDVVRPLYEVKGLYLTADMNDGLPDLLCDEIRIRQVLVNLLSNAGRFTKEGGVIVRVKRSANEVVFSVADTGPGIPKEEQARLFEPFQQADTSIRREHGGSGLGLSISRSFVEMHGGKIWLESEPGVGTTISFSLPVVIAPGEETQQDSYRRWFDQYGQYEQRLRRSRAPLPIATPRYILWEQGGSLRHLFERYSNSAFATSVKTTSVKTSAEALHELNQSPAQALIANMAQILSPIELWGTYQQVSRLPYNTPAIVCWLPGKEEVARDLNVVDYLVKPVTADALLAAVARLGKQIRTVLLVDDEPDLLQLWARILTAAPGSYRVWRARGGDEALAVMRERGPDLVLLDLILPGKDGYTVLQEKQIDEMIRNIPVIVVSATDPVKGLTTAGPILVTRGGGLTAKELMDFVGAVSAVLAPAGPSSGPGSPTNHAG